LAKKILEFYLLLTLYIKEENVIYFSVLF
jgi:hypothetical protein